MAYGAFLTQGPIRSTAKFTNQVGGYFFPQNTGAPTEAKIPNNYVWNVIRSAVGVFKVTVLQTGGMIKPVAAATQNQTPMNIQLSTCIDPAGAVQPIQAQLTGALTLKANNFTFTITVFRTDTNVAYDVIQPGSPTLNGSFILWRVVYSDLYYARARSGGA